MFVARITSNVFPKCNVQYPPPSQYHEGLRSMDLELRGDHIVSCAPDGGFYNYFCSKSEYERDLRKEVVNGYARAIMQERLQQLGVHQLFLDSATIHVERPVEPHLAIFVTEPHKLRKQSDVLIVVGEHSQNLGIWAWRMALRDAGLAKGTAIGLATMVQDTFGHHQHDKDHTVEAKANDSEVLDAKDDQTMGLIILNPGELLWSPQHSCTMTHASWQARPKSSLFALNGIEIDERYNRVPGHANPEEHVTTFFDHVLPQMIDPKARLYIVGIADGADAVLGYIDSMTSADEQAEILQNLAALALLQPTTAPESIKSLPLLSFLATPKARAWELSERLRASLLSTANDQPAVASATANTEDNPAAASTSDTTAAQPAPRFLCDTFSGGVPDILEVLWPSSMSEVLAFFLERQQAAHSH